MTIKSRARSAGRRFGASLAQSGLGMVGGGVYFGAHTLLSPTIYGTETANITKRAWMLPVAGIVGGHLLGMTKVSSVGVGLVGAATAVGIQQIQVGIAAKANQALQPGQTEGVGALLEPGDIGPAQLSAASQQGLDAGALWQSPVHEAAGLSL